jgi:hypothetical protein
MSEVLNSDIQMYSRFEFRLEGSLGLGEVLLVDEDLSYDS